MVQPKTDKEKEKDAQHLKKMLKMARKGPINFGIALGKDDESLAFLAHQARNPKSLRKKAREETGNSKGAHGEMTVDGKDLVFVCQDSPPGPIVKAMRLFLKDLKVPLRAEFRTPEEAAVSAEDREAEAEEAALKERTGLTLNPTIEQVSELDAIDGDALDIDKERGDLVGQLKKLAKQVQQAIKAAPGRKNALLEGMGEIKRLITEIDKKRPERIEHARTRMAEFLKELKSTGTNADAKIGAAEILDQTFVEAVLGGDGAKLAAFKQAFGDKERTDLAKAFGGQRGLTAVGRLLRDVCGNDPSQLRKLSNALA